MRIIAQTGAWAFALGACATRLPCQDRIAEAPVTITQSLDRAVARIGRHLVDVAQAMPEDRYTFRPDSTVRTFAQQLKHVAINNYISAAALRGEAVPVIAQQASAIEGKAAVLEYVRASYIDMQQAVARIRAPEQVLEVVTEAELKLPRLNVVIGMVTHGWNHYGQLTQYLRAAGITPPASR